MHVCVVRSCLRANRSKWKRRKSTFENRSATHGRSERHGRRSEDVLGSLLALGVWIKGGVERRREGGKHGKALMLS